MWLEMLALTELVTYKTQVFVEEASDLWQAMCEACQDEVVDVFDYSSLMDFTLSSLPGNRALRVDQACTPDIKRLLDDDSFEVAGLIHLTDESRDGL